MAGPAQGELLAEQTYHHGNLRDAFIEAALALEPEHGPLGLSLREVARKVGVTHAAAYHHFASKEALVLAVADDGYARLLSAIRAPELPAPFTGAMAALFRLIAVGAEYVRFAFDQPSRFRFMYGTPPVPPASEGSPIPARQAEVLSVFANVVAEAQREGLIAGGKPDRVGAQLWAEAHGLATLTIAGALDGVPRGSARKQGEGARRRRALDLARAAMVGFVIGARPQEPEWRMPGMG
ncbi:MAG: TetR/AcrR family transcriptional regulator [Gemmatimonadota bacterium]|nr:TetR/AcrR family transcriptional regulator [Gemmatimonadota bacterium]